MMRKKSPPPSSKVTNIEAMIRRTPPHLLGGQNKKHLNINASAYMRHPVGDISTNPINASAAYFYHLAYGGSSLPLQHPSMYIPIVPQEGEAKPYLHQPMLLPIISPHEEGTPRSSAPEHQRLSFPGGSNPGGSNSRTTQNHPPYQLSSFYPVLPFINGNGNWNHFGQHQGLRRLHCSEPTAREEQPPLPFYRTSSDANINNSTSNLERSSVLGKRPAASDPAQSFQQPPTTRQHLDAPETGSDEFIDDLFNLVQSLGTPGYRSCWDKVFRSESSMYGPHHTSSGHAEAGSSGTASEPSLSLHLGNDSTFRKGQRGPRSRGRRQTSLHLN